MQLEEALDPFARLGRDLRRLGGGAEPEHEVELAPPRDLDDARELDLAQLDGRPRERAHDGGGIAGIDEQPQPGEHVAHLGALEKRVRRFYANRRRLHPVHGGPRLRRAIGRAGRRRRGDSGAGHPFKDTRGDCAGHAKLMGRLRAAATLEQ